MNFEIKSKYVVFLYQFLLGFYFLALPFRKQVNRNGLLDDTGAWSLVFLGVGFLCLALVSAKHLDDTTVAKSNSDKAINLIGLVSLAFAVFLLALKLLEAW